MDAETQPATDHHDFGAQWVDMGPYGTHQQSPINDYTGFVFASSPVMPMEPAYSMSIPQPYTSQQLLPLSMPSQWPNMLSTQPGFAPVPLAPMPPMQSMAAPPPPPHNTHYVTTSTPRRTLTDADRRRMCLYHEENPTVKQTEIGAMFGVERSTVSKVLRQKEKYLYPDDGNRSPVKKAKGKFPDIEKALANWVRNFQRQGGHLTDAVIREKALFFASTVGGREGHQKVMTSTWLEKFKQKNCIPGSVSRRGSIDVNGNIDTSNERSISESTNCFSPDSVSASSSPLSPKPDPDVVGKTGSARSTPRLDGSEFAIKAEAMSRSPSGSTHTRHLFSPDNPFVSAGQASNQKRPRSQTFPVTNTEPGFMANGTADPVSPKSSGQAGIVVPVLDDESPSEPARMRRNHSNPEIKTNMQPPRLRKSNTVSPVGGSPVSPTQDEARQALELVMSYFKNQPSGLAAQDFFTIGKLMEKLEIAQSQALAAAQASSLQRIEEYPGTPRVSKKRSIHTL